MREVLRGEQLLRGSVVLNFLILVSGEKDNILSVPNNWVLTASSNFLPVLCCTGSGGPRIQNSLRNLGDLRPYSPTLHGSILEDGSAPDEMHASRTLQEVPNFQEPTKPTFAVFSALHDTILGEVCTSLLSAPLPIPPSFCLHAILITPSASSAAKPSAAET